MFLVTLIAGVVLLSIWFAMHRSVSTLVAEIKAQMPPNPVVEQGAAEPPEASGGTVEHPNLRLSV